MPRAASLSPDSLSPSSLRLWPPSPRGNIPRPPVGPDTARARINGLPFQLRHWTAQAWERTPIAERPATTFLDDRGGRFALEQVGE